MSLKIMIIILIIKPIFIKPLKKLLLKLLLKIFQKLINTHSVQMEITLTSKLQIAQRMGYGTDIDGNVNAYEINRKEIIDNNTNI